MKFQKSVHGIAKAVSWFRANFSQPMKVEELAELAHMSVSSFLQHFKSVTLMSPLQFQKGLNINHDLIVSVICEADGVCRAFRDTCATPPTEHLIDF